MAGYVGSDAQMRLMRQSDDHVDWTRGTRGACNIGRMLGCDDIPALGWDTIFRVLERDGAFGFRLLDIGVAEAAASELKKNGYRLDLWDVFVASRNDAMPPVEAVLAAGLPPDVSRIDVGSDPEHAVVHQVQEFMLANGIVPFSGSMLTGKCGPSRIVALADAGRAIVAAAYTYMPHNAMSPHSRKAWGGLVAVDPAQRGRRLGLYVNAAIVKAAFEELAAADVYELVSQTNVPSRRMVESCGLLHDPAIVSGAAVLADGARYTR